MAYLSNYKPVYGIWVYCNSKEIKRKIQLTTTVSENRYLSVIRYFWNTFPPLTAVITRIRIGAAYFIRLLNKSSPKSDSGWQQEQLIMIMNGLNNVSAQPALSGFVLVAACCWLAVNFYRNVIGNSGIPSLCQECTGAWLIYWLPIRWSWIFAIPQYVACNSRCYLNDNGKNWCCAVACKRRSLAKLKT